MFFLYDFFGDSNALNPTGNNTSIDTMQINGGIFNGITLLNAIYEDTNIFNKQYNNEWNTNTILNSKLNRNVNAGALSQFVSNIDYLDVQRKEEGGEWVSLYSIHKNNDGSITSNFALYDNFAENDKLYSYKIVPIDMNGNEGSSIQVDALSKFGGAYIADTKNIYNIVYDYAINNSQRNQVSGMYTPYGSKYPYIVFNSVTNYDSGTINATLLAPTSVSSTSSYLDRKAQKELVDEFNSWLTNGEAKVIKDFNGFYKIVSIIDAVSNSYYKELGNGLASTSFKFVEIGEFSNEYLSKLGIKDNFKFLKRE